MRARLLRDEFLPSHMGNMTTGGAAHAAAVVARTVAIAMCGRSPHCCVERIAVE
jgi:hypothetical protein